MVDGAVAATAEGLYRDLDDQEPTAVRRLPLRVIDIDDPAGLRGRRMVRTQADLADQLWIRGCSPPATAPWNWHMSR